MSWFFKNKILVIEDDKDMSTLLHLFLTDLGKFNVDLASDGATGLELVNNKPDLILLDWMLPDTDGLAVLKKLKSIKKTSNIPTIMLTSKREIGYEEAAIENGAVDFLTKPFNPQVMLSRINLYLQ